MQTFEEKSIIITTWRKEHIWHLVVAEHPEWSFSSRRLSRTIYDLRNLLENEEWFLLCNASRMEVHCFNRTAVQKGGTQGWVLSLTEKFYPDDPAKTPRVDLLAPIPEGIHPATLAEQKTFWDRWMTKGK